MLQQASTPQPGTGGSWGLGHTLYSTTEAGNYIFGHGGGSFPASGSEMLVNPDNGDALVILASGTQGLTSEWADVWVYWETGRKNFDIRHILRRRLISDLASIIIGSLLIVYLRHFRRQNLKT